MHADVRYVGMNAVFRTSVHTYTEVYMFSQTYLHINTRIGRCPRSRYVGALFRWGIRHRSCSRHEIKAIDRRCTGCTLQDTLTGTNWWAIDDLSANLDANWFHFVNEIAKGAFYVICIFSQAYRKPRIRFLNLPQKYIAGYFTWHLKWYFQVKISDEIQI